MFWEYLLLSSSRFRNRFEETLLKFRQNPFFELFPLLDVDGDPRLDTGKIEHLHVQPNPRSHQQHLDPSQLEKIGASIAFLCWFGITDLHVENMAFGWNETGFIFAPLDIEEVLADLHSPMDAVLIPSSYIPVERSGIYGLLNYLTSLRPGSLPEAIPAIIHGYLNTLSFLNENQAAIETLLLEELEGDVSTLTARVYFRKTRSYQNYLNGIIKSTEFEIPLAPSEQEQLARSDIPYYFRRMDSLEVFYFRNPEEVVIAEIGSMREQFKCLNARLIHGASIQPRSGFNDLFKMGTAQLARAIDLAEQRRDFQSNYKRTTVTGKGSNLFINDGRSLAIGFARLAKNPNYHAT